MRKGWIAAAVVSVFALGWSAGQVFSQDAGKEAPKKEGGEEQGPFTKEEMEAWGKYMTPGEAHKKMAEMEGDWEVVVKSWMTPKGDPSESVATASIKMILGGRYQTQEVHGNFMGMPFEGRGLAAFDNGSKEHIGCWVDNMGTGVMVTKGTQDAAGKITSAGECVDPMGGKCSMREVWTPISKDSFKMEMWSKQSKFPEEYKCMELTYTRKAVPAPAPVPAPVPAPGGK
jgi:hypothetical protein